VKNGSKGSREDLAEDRPVETATPHQDAHRRHAGRDATQATITGRWRVPSRKLFYWMSGGPILDLESFCQRSPSPTNQGTETWNGMVVLLTSEPP